VFEQVEDVEEGEEGEEKEAWEVSSEHNIAVESVVPKKRSRGQLKIHDIDTPSGSKGVLQVTEAQIHQISDAVTKRLASTLDTRTKKKKIKIVSSGTLSVFFFDFREDDSQCLIVLF